MRRLEEYPEREIGIEGCLLPYWPDGETPILLAIEGVLFLPLFSTKAKYDDAMVHLGFAENCPKQIDEAAGFWESVEGKVRVCLDPWITPDRKTRFTELRRS